MIFFKECRLEIVKLVRKCMCTKLCVTQFDGKIEEMRRQVYNIVTIEKVEMESDTRTMGNNERL